MKIFIVCTRLCFGGAERVAAMLANGLSQRGHQITLIANLFDDITYPICSDVELKNLFPQRKNKYLKWITSFFLLRKYVRQEKPDVVVGIMWTCSLRSKFACIGKSIPVVSTIHDALERPASAKFSHMESFHMFQLNKLYDHVTVLTNADKAIAEKMFKNTHVMPNPLSLEPLGDVPPKRNVILAAGRLEDWYYKGFDLLIEAWGKLSAKHPDWILQIAGVGNKESQQFLIDLAIKSGMAPHQFQLLGFKENIIDVYREAAIFVLSSRYEAFGLVLLEAMSQGCACIACDYKGRQHEIIRHGNEGLLCIPEQVEDLVAKLDTLLTDIAYREKLQKNAIEASKRFLPNKIIDKWEKLLFEITR